MRKLITPLFGLALLLAAIWAVSVAVAATGQIRAGFAPLTPIVGYDFEDGTVDSWTVNTNTLTTTIGLTNTTSQHYSGTHSLQANIHDTSANTITLSAVDVPNVSTGNIITAHVQLRSSSVVVAAEAALGAIDANGNPHFGAPVSLTTNQWATITMVFTNPVPMPLQELGVGVGVGRLPFLTFDGSYYVDDVEWDTVVFPTATPTAPPTDTSTPLPSDTPLPPTGTPVPSDTPTATNTPPPVTNTPLPLTGTPLPATNTPLPPTDTPAATNTPGGPTNTPIPTNTPAPATNTPQPSTTPTDCPNPFVDTNGNIFYPAIHYLNCRRVVNGTDASHYSPGGTSTRGQFAKVVVLGFGTPFYTPTTPDFVDVPPSYFAYIYIESGFHAGILSGFDPGTCAAHGLGNPCYLPNLPITRGQLTKLVVNAGGYQLYTPSGGQDFTDVPPNNVFYASIETAYHNSIINGYSDHTFRPNNNIRRDEMAQIVYEGIIHKP